MILLLMILAILLAAGVTCVFRKLHFMNKSWGDAIQAWLIVLVIPFLLIVATIVLMSLNK